MRACLSCLIAAMALSSCGRTGVFDDPSLSPCAPDAVATFSFPVDSEAKLSAATTNRGYALAWSSRLSDGGVRVALSMVDGEGALGETRELSVVPQVGELIAPSIASTGEGLVVSWVDRTSLVASATPIGRLFDWEGNPVSDDVILGNIDPADPTAPLFGSLGASLVGAWDLGALSFGGPNITKSVVASFKHSSLERAREDEPANDLKDIPWRAFAADPAGGRQFLLLSDGALHRLPVDPSGSLLPRSALSGDVPSGRIDAAASSVGSGLRLIAARSASQIRVLALQGGGETQLAATVPGPDGVRALAVSGARTGAWVVVRDEKDELRAIHSRSEDVRPVFFDLGTGVTSLASASREEQTLVVFSAGSEVRGALLRCGP